MEKEVCQFCKRDTDKEDMTEYEGDWMCEGCAENSDMFATTNDPHGKDWQANETNVIF